LTSSSMLNLLLAIYPKRTTRRQIKPICSLTRTAGKRKLCP